MVLQGEGNQSITNRLKDIRWTVGVIGQWAVNPSEYTEAHQKAILLTINVIHQKIDALIKDEEQARANAKKFDI